MNDVELSENGPFKQEDLDEIKKVRPNISDGLKNDIISVTDKLEGLGEENFKNEYSAKKDLNSDDKWFYASEQAYKLYAYSPLDKARNKLAAAVESKDMLRIREEHEKYKETKKVYDKMLKTVKKHPTGLSAGNINSTRPMANNAVNPLPLEHMQDFVGHSQLNGLYCLYALGKNTNSTPAQLLEDPIKVMSDAGEQYTQENGLNSRQTTGEKLFWGLSESTCDNFSHPWTGHTGQLCTRAFDNIACMAEDPQEQNRIAGVGQLALAAGTVPVNKHIKAWEKVYKCSKEQRNVMLQHAVLLPADEFDPLAYGEAFSKPDWKEKLDTGALIDRMKQEGKLDYDKLADRVEEIAAEAQNCKQEVGSKFDRDKLIYASHKMFKEIIKKATPQERETEGFKKLENYTNKMLLTTEIFKEAQEGLEEDMDIQKQDKKGVFLSSTNTDEHDKMVRSQNTFRYKLMQMQGKPLPDSISEEDREFLKTISLKDAYETARDATFDYAVKKTDKGRSTFFVHNTGSQRYHSAMDSLEVMDSMADTLELRSPAQKMIDETRLEIFNGRRQRDWTNEKAEKAAAKLMYAMTIAHQTDSPEEQKKKLTPKKIEDGVTFIRGQDAFRQMIRNEGAAGVMDKIAEGHGKFTDAFVKGMNDVARKNHQQVGKAPQDMQAEEKGQVWKNNPLPM